MSLQLTCEAAGPTSVRVRAVNQSDVEVHVFDSERMPYLIQPATGELLISYAVTPPDPDVDYYFIEIPMTRPLPPGEAVEHAVEVRSVVLHDHYESDRSATRLEGSLLVRCEFGFTLTPITEADRAQIAIDSLLAMQQTAVADPVRLELG